MIRKPWWKLSWIWLFPSKKRRALSQFALIGHSVNAALISLGLGVMALSLTLAVFSGFQKTLAEKMSSEIGHIRYRGEWRDRGDFLKFLSSQEKEISRAHMFWRGQALLIGKKSAKGVLIEGRESWPEAQFSSTEMQLQLGSALAKQLGVEEGDRVRLMVPGLLNRAVNVPVVSVRSTGVYQLDSRLVVIGHRALKVYLQDKDPELLARHSGDYSNLRLFMSEGDLAVTNENFLNEKVRDLSSQISRFWGQKIVDVESWRDMRENLFKSIGMDKNILSVILSLIVLVAALNVAAALIVLYFERDRQIATFRALGLGPRDLRWWVMSQGFILGVVASLIGLLASFALGQAFMHWVKIPVPEEIYNLDHLPLLFDWTEQLWVFFFGTFTACCFAFLVGLSLAKTPIEESLGHRR